MMLSQRIHFDNSYRYNPRLFEDILLYQIGDLICEPSYRIHEHSQFCYEISYIVSGTGTYYTNNKAYTVNKGDVYLCIPGQLHDGVADKTEPFRYFYFGFSFNESDIANTMFSKIKKGFDSIERPVCRDIFQIQEPFIEIFNEIINGSEMSDIMIKSNLYKIIILAYRNYFDTARIEYSSKHNTDNTKIIVYNIINYIDSNLGKISELADIADFLGYSYPHLSKVFSVETGTSIQEYYENKRFEHAMELLRHSDLSITRISDIIGYQSIHSFSKAFKKRFDFSPTKYRQSDKNLSL